jgi:hypothetical protein
LHFSTSMSQICFPFRLAQEVTVVSLWAIAVCHHREHPFSQVPPFFPCHHRVPTISQPSVHQPELTTTLKNHFIFPQFLPPSHLLNTHTHTHTHTHTEPLPYSQGVYHFVGEERHKAHAR